MQREDEESKSVSKQMFYSRMQGKKDVQNNIKAMLAKTKVGDSMTTSTAVQVSNKKNFVKPNKPAPQTSKK